MRALRLIAVLAFASTASAQDVVVEVGPHAFHQRTLGNGLRAVAVRDEQDSASVFVVIGAGKRHETPETTGLAHLTEHAMYTGTDKLGLGQHDRRIQAMGGESNAFTRSDYTLFYDHKVPSEKLGDVLAMEADRLRGLKLEEDGVLFERERLRREESRTWKATEARKEQLESVVYTVHPYRAGVLDADGHTKAPTLGVDAVRAFYDRYYHPDNAAVVVVAPSEPSKVLDAIETAFGALPRGAERPAVPVEPDVEKSRRHELTADLPRDRCHLVWLVPELGHPDRPALAVLARLLARQTTKQNVPIDAELGSRVDRELFVLATTGEGAEDVLERLMLSVYEGAFSAKDIEQVRELLADDFTSLPLRARPYFSLAGTFGVYAVLDRLEALTGFAAAVRAVDADAVRDAARKHLRPKTRIIVQFQSSGSAPKPLPEDRRGLQTAAEEAVEAGDLARAITAYTRLLEKRPNKMFRVIYLASRGQVYVKQKDYAGAISDYEEALGVIDYPAVRDLLAEARKLQAAAGGAPQSKPASRPQSRPSRR